MKISEFIEQLQFHQRLHGDLEVVNLVNRPSWGPIPTNENYARVEPVYKGVPGGLGQDGYVRHKLLGPSNLTDKQLEMLKEAGPELKVLLLP